MVDEAVDPQPVVDEGAVEQGGVLGGVGVDAVVPEVRRDVILGVLARFRVEMLEKPLHRPDEREPDPLHDPGVTQRERGGRDPADDDDHHRRGEDRTPPSSIRATGIDVVEVAQQPGGEHQRDVDDDEEQEPHQDQEMQRPGHLDAQHGADPPEPGG